jgi:hypothetical protein
MGRKDKGDPAITLHLSISDKEVFIERCVNLLKTVALADLVYHPPKIDNFLQAYVLARAMPFVAENRLRGEDWRAEETMDDLLGEVASQGELFLNDWTPRSATEAALLLDLVNSIGEPCINTNHILPAVEAFLFETMRTSRVGTDSLIDPLAAVRLEATPHHRSAQA